jgi:hypothetical protein
MKGTLSSDQKAENLRKLLQIFNEERLNPADFAAAFQKVIEHVKGTQQLTVQHLQLIVATVTTAFTNHSEDTKAQIAALRDETDRHLAGHIGEIARLDAAIAKIPKPKDGKDADEDVIIEKVLARLPPPAAPLIGDDFRNHLEALQGNDRLDKSAIRGLDELEKQVKNNTLVIGNAPGTGLANSSGNIGRFQYLKFPGATITTLDDTATVTVGGGGFTALQSTETPDGNTTVFTFLAATAQPSYVRSDNVLLKATSKSGTVNWTWNAGAKQATLTVPPTDDVEAIV